MVWLRNNKVIMKRFRKIIIIKKIILFSNFPLFYFPKKLTGQNKLSQNKKTKSHYDPGFFPWCFNSSNIREKAKI